MWDSVDKLPAVCHLFLVSSPHWTWFHFVEQEPVCSCFSVAFNPSGTDVLLVMVELREDTPSRGRVEEHSNDYSTNICFLKLLTAYQY